MILPLCLSILWVALVGAKCYESSQAHPLPEYDLDDINLKQAFASISNALTLAVAPEEYESTSFSVEITSSKESLYSYHHTALVRNASRPDAPEVNGNVLYRIASITKTFTVLGVLYQHGAGNLSLDDPIDKYIAELKEKQEGTIPWKDITLRSLASQLSGIPRDFAQVDLINPRWTEPYTPEELGLPPVSRDGLLECDEYAPNYEPNLMGAVKSSAPVFAPNQESTYSNVNYELLGLAIENVTNQTYESYIAQAIFEPLDMTKSTLAQPPDSAGVIPFNPQFQSWDWDAGIQNPTGGIFSSSTDLSKFLRYILTKYNGITHAINWIHPVSPSRGLNTFYGMPWEIFHTDRILKESRRTVKFITKAGGLPGYTSIIITVPDYDLGFTILVAGNSGLCNKIREIVTVATVRAAEQIAIEQLNKRYAGTYTSTDPDVNSSITLVADHRGLIVSDFISNSTDVLSSVVRNLLRFEGDKGYAQLIPTLLFKDEATHSGEFWRINFANERTEGEHDVWDDFCMTNIGGVSYAKLPINEMSFWGGEDGGAYETVELTGFRAKLSRKADDDTQRASDWQENLEL
ncbi:beta-lactamase/transpeptidase-like protein [Pleomassaria siparia CBS 279.74]|uniref:Beta-lactamase/transpeptidase-like protein n=1 Tax=Pleomassaria siparia CBS 279.74 TaxID=1314801 RepID=A0A6G1KCR9_9PLEO|nr:beta-lactamase/transpeptidase-like protein [Pleomassaria siparia CBS 279.74]